MNAIDNLIEQFRAEVDALMERLSSGDITIDDWEIAFAVLIATYHQAAMMLGLGRAALLDSEIVTLAQVIEEQMMYLNGFAKAIYSDPELIRRWAWRSDLYTKAIKESYWRGETRMLPLPGWPAQGTICGNNCGCSWSIVPINAELGDFDCYWVRGKADSCDTCIQREAQWRPVVIRNWIRV